MSTNPRHRLPHGACWPASIRAGKWIVYLMYRRGPWLPNRTGEKRFEFEPAKASTHDGPAVRVGQEHADKAWILMVCETRAEASDSTESHFSRRPTGCRLACFHGGWPRTRNGRGSGLRDYSRS